MQPAGRRRFEYVIHNADGGEVEQCSRRALFARYVHDKGLTQKDASDSGRPVQGVIDQC